MNSVHQTRFEFFRVSDCVIFSPMWVVENPFGSINIPTKRPRDDDDGDADDDDDGDDEMMMK